MQVAKLAGSTGDGGEGGGPAAVRGRKPALVCPTAVIIAHTCWISAHTCWIALTSACAVLLPRCIRPDKVMLSVQAFVTEHLGQRFIEPPPFDLSSCYKESSPTTPLIFVLSSGADPMADLLKLAEEMKFTKKFEKVSKQAGGGRVGAGLGHTCALLLLLLLLLLQQLLTCCPWRPATGLLQLALP